jgi:threonine dehydrogenase-like Zn-dependent dehydrogenase
MQVVVALPGARELRLVERPEQWVLGPHHARVRVLDVGVCGTDREIARFEYGTPPPGSEELVLGHEALGEVLEVGAEVRELAVGQLVVPSVRRPCSHPGCRPCRSQRPDMCASGEYLERGIQRADGYLAEQFVEDVQYLQPVPAELRQVGVLVEPLSLAERAMAQYWSLQSRLPWLRPGQANELNAVVIGAGPVGLLGALVLTSHGFRVTVVSRGEGPDARSNFAESLGPAFLSSDGCNVDAMVGHIGPIDLVYEASGASPFAFKFMERLAENGVFIFTGVPGRKAPVEFDAAKVMRNVALKNQLVFASVASSRADYAAAVTDLVLFRRRWRDALQSLISGRTPVEGFRELLQGESKDMKEVLSFDA